MNQIESNNNFPLKKRIKFCLFDKSSIEYDYNIIYSINPKLIITKSTMDEEGKYIINLPEKIRKEDLVEFLFLYIGNNKHDDNNYFTNSRNKFISIINQNKKKFESFLEILLFFNNESFNNFIINNIFIPEMKKEKIVDFLLFSYRAIQENKNSDPQNSSSYINLFNICFQKISNNEKFLIKYYNKLKIFENNILRKIIEKIFFNLLNLNCLLNTDEDSEDSIKLDGYDEGEDSNKEKKSIVINNDIPNKIDEVGEEYVSIDYNKINESSISNSKERNYIIKFEDYRKLINILMEISSIYNIYDLLSIEYINILSNVSMNELNSNKKKYVFQKKFYFNSIKNNNLIYEECPLEIIINNKTVILVIFFQPFERSINVCIKLKDNKITDDKLFEHLSDSDFCFKLFTFYTSVQISKGYNIFNTKKHNSIISITNNKSMYNIFKSSINNTELNNNNFLNQKIKEEFFIIRAEIKICYIYTALISYLLQDFSSFSNDTHITKLSKQLFILILSNKYLDKKNENDIVNTILLWLNDEINIKEDISEIFYNVNWENVDDSLIFELIVKYSHYISNNESIQLIFYKIFEDKYGKSPLIKKLINNIISASRKINYEKIFSQMKNNDKFNNAYITYNSYLNITNNKYKYLQGLQDERIPTYEKIINKKINDINNKKKFNNSKKKEQQKTKKGNSYIGHISNNSKKNKSSISSIKMNNKNFSIKQLHSTFFIKKREEENSFDLNLSKGKKYKKCNTLEKLKKAQNKISFKKLSVTKIINKRDNTNYNKKIKPVLTKNSSSDFMKLTMNNTSSVLYNFQNLFNKTFNSNTEFNEKKEKIENYNSIKKNNSISIIKKNKIKISKK